jgi:16S rRNA U1498 N3-methylase RsmE
MTEILEQRLGPVETGPPLLLAQALLKGDHMDWVVQKASELGVRTILPLDLTAWRRTTAARQDRRPSGPLAAHRH